MVEVEGRQCLLIALDFEGLGSFERSAQVLFLKVFLAFACLLLHTLTLFTL